MRIESSLDSSYQPVSTGTSTGAATADSSSSAADTVQLSAPTNIYATDGRQDLQAMDPDERLAAMAMEALEGHQVEWLEYRPPVSIGVGVPEPDATDSLRATYAMGASG